LIARFNLIQARPNLFQNHLALCYCVPVKRLSSATIALVLSATIVAQSHPPPDYSANVARQVAKVHRDVGPMARGPAFRPNWNSLAAYRTPDWFRDAKFGIFLHWGVYSVPAFGNEWYSRNMYVPGSREFEHQVAVYGSQAGFGYKDFIPMFKGQNFDPGAWVDLFVRAGARYIVPVGEHCDGFAMYDSDMTPWNATRMGPHRDVVGELAAAARARGLRFGVSSHTAEHWWWYDRGRSFPSDVRDMNPYTALLYGPAEHRNLPNPDGTTNDAHEPDPNHLEEWVAPDHRYLDNWLALSTEIVDKYHPDLIYFDWWIGQPAFQPVVQQFAAYYYDDSAKRHQQPVLTYKEEAMPANVATLDIERGKLDSLRLLPWQTDTSVSVHSWGYVENDQYRTAKSLIHQLVDTVSKNGNLLLNVGPESDGTLPEQARSVLLQMGAWLRINGDAIYNTRPFAVYGEGPTKTPSDAMQMNHDIQVYTAQDIRYTTSKSGSILYATALGWPTDATLTLHSLYTENPYLPSPVCRVKLMGTGQDIRFKQQPDGLHLTIPIAPPKSLPRDIAYVFVVTTHCQAATH
jgi:alpha-L-fucosidase